MKAEAIQAICDLAKTETFEINGITYSSRAVFDTRKPEPQPKALGVSTLTGFVDYVTKVYPLDRDNENDLRLFPVAVHVEAPGSVALIGDLYGDFDQRDTYARVTCPDSAFQFGQYHDSEAFIIALQSLFVPNDARARVLAVLGNLKEETVRVLADDGVTQTVTARAGIATVQELAVPNPVVLCPYRTFRELQQPESPFILRLKQDKGGDKPKCALFEADGGEWKLEAIERTRDYLAERLKDSGIPIIA